MKSPHFCQTHSTNLYGSIPEKFQEYYIDGKISMQKDENGVGSRLFINTLDEGVSLSIVSPVC
ncbi:hypothetical protein BACI349Y_50256 [Bacillus sp. 349Y]|nr:hypothetical protein BACI349Y_50256 [Bacillus sp. 349Y]